MSKNFICPMPQVWNKIYQALLKARERRNDISIPKPPVPLILAAWHEPHIIKMARWKETITWAEKYGFTDLIPLLSDQDSYFDE